MDGYLGTILSIVLGVFGLFIGVALNAPLAGFIVGVIIGVIIALLLWHRGNKSTYIPSNSDRKWGPCSTCLNKDSRSCTYEYDKPDHVHGCGRHDKYQ